MFWNYLTIIYICWETITNMKTHIIALLLLTGGVLNLFGENLHNFFNRYNFSFITEDTGLPHNFINDIYKDTQGYIWVATNNGIGRYNGYQFIHYNSQSHSIRLKNDYVHKVCEDKFQRLWIGSKEGIDLIDLKHYTQIDTDKELPAELKSLANNYIASIYRDKQDNLWISTDKNLWYLELGVDGQIKDYYKLKKDTESPIHAVIDLQEYICAGIDNP